MANRQVAIYQCARVERVGRAQPVMGTNYKRKWTDVNELTEPPGSDYIIKASERKTQHTRKYKTAADARNEAEVQTASERRKPRILWGRSRLRGCPR
jgi:hypothetical protein